MIVVDLPIHCEGILLINLIGLYYIDDARLMAS